MVTSKDRQTEREGGREGGRERERCVQSVIVQRSIQKEGREIDFSRSI